MELWREWVRSRFLQPARHLQGQRTDCLCVCVHAHARAFACGICGKVIPCVSMKAWSRSEPPGCDDPSHWDSGRQLSRATEASPKISMFVRVHDVFVCACADVGASARTPPSHEPCRACLHLCMPAVQDGRSSAKKTSSRTSLGLRIMRCAPAQAGRGLSRPGSCPGLGPGLGRGRQAALIP